MIPKMHIILKPTLSILIKLIAIHKWTKLWEIRQWLWQIHSKIITSRSILRSRMRWTKKWKNLKLLKWIRNWKWQMTRECTLWVRTRIFRIQAAHTWLLTILEPTSIKLEINITCQMSWLTKRKRFHDTMPVSFFIDQLRSLSTCTLDPWTSLMSQTLNISAI